jgi:hypothetical protein
MALVSLTPAHVAAFQRLHVGPDGQKLLPDGDWGARTQWAFDLEALPGYRQDIVLMGLRFVGTVELAPNSGPEIDAWLKACKAEPGDPWCAAFASMCLRAGRIEAREASVQRLAAMFPETSSPLPGDLCCVHHPDGTGHVDIVTGLATIDGVLIASVVGGNVGNAVRAGLRYLKGRKFYRVGATGCPLALDIPTLPLLGSQDR